MQKEYAGTDLAEIRESLREYGFTEAHQDNGERGFDLWRPFLSLPSHECAHAVVWPRKDGGFWVEQYRRSDRAMKRPSIADLHEAAEALRSDSGSAALSRVSLWLSSYAVECAEREEARRLGCTVRYLRKVKESQCLNS